MRNNNNNIKTEDQNQAVIMHLYAYAARDLSSDSQIFMRNI